MTLVRAKRAAPRHKAIGGQPTPKVPAQPFVFPAPSNGWVLNTSRANPMPASAHTLDNFIARPDGIEVRGGTQKYANIGDEVQSLWSYSSGGSERLFAATQAAVYDITAPASTEAVPTAAITGQTSGVYVTEQFGTSGGDFLYAVNGSEAPQLYNGSTWQAVTGASSPISLTGVTTSNLSHVWSYASRLFFIEKNTMKVWYLSADTLGGAANVLNLSSVFSKGGTLLWGARWSLDAGDGLDDKWVVCTTEGEVAVYSGTNPGSASTWAIQGVYALPRPLGPKSILRISGDVLIGTEYGLIPLSIAVREDSARLSQAALSAPIESYWQDEARRLSPGWEIMKLDLEGIVVVSQPIPAFRPVSQGTALCADAQTGAWSRFTGVDMSCLTQFGDDGYFGARDGYVYKMQTGGRDDDRAYVASYLGQFEPMGAYGAQKTVMQSRAIWDAGTPIAPQLTANTDFDDTLPTAPASFTAESTAVWDTAVWDADVWDGVSAPSNSGATWVSVGVTGYAIAPVVQVTVDSQLAPVATLVAVEAEYSGGARVA